MSTPITSGPGFPDGQRESLWPARIAILAVLALQLLLNPRLTAGPNWLLPGLELLLLLPLSALRGAQRRSLHHYGHLLLPGGRKLPSHGFSRVVAFGLIALLNLANLYSLILLLRSLLHGSKASGAGLLIDALDLWLTTVMVYALWYWELDRGGPLRRGSRREEQPDFLFPQMSMPQASAPSGPPEWRPTFVDYLFLSFTSSAAFSPTDTLPLSRQAKLLMMAQAGTSLLTTLLVAGRAVNILA